MNDVELIVEAIESLILVVKVGLTAMGILIACHALSAIPNKEGLIEAIDRLRRKLK